MIHTTPTTIFPADDKTGALDPIESPRDKENFIRFDVLLEKIYKKYNNIRGEVKAA